MNYLFTKPNDLKAQGSHMLIRERINPEEILSVGLSVRSKKSRISINTSTQNRKDQFLLSKKQVNLNKTQDSLQNTPQKLRINLNKLSINKKFSGVEDKPQNQLNSEDINKKSINRQTSEIKLSYRMGLSIFEDVSVKGEDDLLIEDPYMNPFISPSRELKNIRIIPDERNNISNIREKSNKLNQNYKII